MVKQSENQVNNQFTSLKEFMRVEITASEKRLGDRIDKLDIKIDKVDAKVEKLIEVVVTLREQVANINGKLNQ